VKKKIGDDEAKPTTVPPSVIRPPSIRTLLEFEPFVVHRGFSHVSWRLIRTFFLTRNSNAKQGKFELEK